MRKKKLAWKDENLFPEKNITKKFRKSVYLIIKIRARSKGVKKKKSLFMNL